VDHSALFVSIGRESTTHLKDLGYVEALRRWGWDVTWEHLNTYDGTGMERYDLVMWDGAIPERALQRIERRQILVAMGGVGDKIEYYRRYIDKIRCATTSLFYFDEPRYAWSLNNISRDLILPHRFWREFRYERRFTRFASPRFWREFGMRLVYLPYASDPALFHPLPNASKRWRWGFCGTIYNRHFIRQLMKTSRSRSVPFHVAAKELGTAIPPASLNEFYNQLEIGANEHWHGVLGRELNQRLFDLGMAGIFQITDMEWLARELVGPYAAFYAGKAADRRARKQGAELVLHFAHSFSPDEIHWYFRRRHSFEARLAKVSRTIGEDLSLGKATWNDLESEMVGNMGARI